MLTFLISIATSVVLKPLFLLGYSVAILLPIPFLNRAILDLWAKFGGKIMSIFRSATGKVVDEKALLTTAVENAVVSSVTTTVTKVEGTVANAVTLH